MRHGEAAFVDSGTWIALALSRDPLHAQAREQWDVLQRAGAKLHTSIPVVIETFTFLDRNANRDVALAWKESIYKPRTVKILNFEIAQLAGKDLHRSGLIDRLFPRQRHIAVGVAIEKSERLDYDRDRRVKFGARSLQDVPLFPGLRVKRITRKSKGNPRSAVDKRGFAVPHQGSS